MTYKFMRRGSVRIFGLSILLIAIVYLIYIQRQSPLIDFRKRSIELHHDGGIWEKCTLLNQTSTKITTTDEYSKFDFQPKWMHLKRFWDEFFENRYEKCKIDDRRPQLKIIIVPHSHNDPGWRKSFAEYFESDSKLILNYVIDKMQKCPEMTFIWSEISILQLWWDQAHPSKQIALKQLIQSGRFEITTGGWVMTDEANVHIYAMIDQFIEGHQWVKANLNYKPVTGWSVDPFGHGSTVPYLLSASGFKGTVIQRIHYTWKRWLAEHQYGDFIWQSHWLNDDEEDTHSILTHNLPFDLYSIKHSCGPYTNLCLNFDFRKIPGEYSESTAEYINNENIKAKATQLIEQYAKSASLYPHNVALIPLGDDFRYNKEPEMEQQYTNYKKLIDHINANKAIYKAEISFGLPKDYFQAIRERYQQFPTLKGDFFVYGDIYSEGKPAYWSGYFTTRPMYKILSRELENQLRSSEILFTVGYNKARQMNNTIAMIVLERNYEKIILARRNLGLFQHHDAITGTSTDSVMRDYGKRLFDSIQYVVKLQESCIESLIQKQPKNHHSFVLSDTKREAFNKLSSKLPMFSSENNISQFVIYNSGSQSRSEVITIRTLSANVEIWDSQGVKMEIQINPVWSISDNFGDYNANARANMEVSNKQFDVLFLAILPAMSLSTFTIKSTDNYKTRMATIYCNDCKEKSDNAFEIHAKKAGDIRIENNKMKLLFDEQSGLLKSVTRESMANQIQLGIKFAAFGSSHSGVYLLRTNPAKERNILEEFKDKNIIITSGPISSDVTVIYAPFLQHTVRIYKTKTDIDNGIYIENVFDQYGTSKDTELFMRFTTDIKNGENPILYTDLNGFQYQKRVKVPTIGIEGNYYPITTAAFIQDEKTRLTLLTHHAQGATSYETGQLEVMVYRRTVRDDGRGMGEGVVEDGGQARHKYWLLIEDFQVEDSKSNEKNEYQVPSLFSNHLSNTLIYPSNVYSINNQHVTYSDLKYQVNFIQELPCDLHMTTLRTLTKERQFPSCSALMVLHRQAYSCMFMGDRCKKSVLSKNIFDNVRIESISSTTLTGLEKIDNIKDFSSINVKPMDIQTFNLTFS